MHDQEQALSFVYWPAALAVSYLDLLLTHFGPMQDLAQCRVTISVSGRLQREVLTILWPTPWAGCPTSLQHQPTLDAAPTRGHQLALRAAPGDTHWPSWLHQPDGTLLSVFRSACSRPLISAPVVLEVVVPQSYGSPNTIIMACACRPDSPPPKDYQPTI